MRIRALWSVALACSLFLAGLGRADDKVVADSAEPPASFKPVVLLRLKALDDLMAQLRHEAERG